MHARVGYNSSMKYIGPAIKYGLHNLKYMLPFVVLPAMFIGVFTRPFCLSNYLYAYPNMSVNNYMDIFGAFFNFSWQNIVLTALGFLLVVMVMTLLHGFIERHMRTGKFSIHEASSIINGNILAVGLCSLFIIVLYMVCMIILSLVVFWLHLLISGLGNVPTLFNVAVVYALGVLVSVGFIRLAMQMYLAIPEVISTGYSFNACLSEVGDKMNRSSFGIWLAYVLPLFVHIPVLVLSNGYWWCRIILFVLMTLYMVYYLSLTYVVYFAISGFSRVDYDTHLMLFRRKLK